MDPPPQETLTMRFARSASCCAICFASTAAVHSFAPHPHSHPHTTPKTRVHNAKSCLGTYTTTHTHIKAPSSRSPSCPHPPPPPRPKHDMWATHNELCALCLLLCDLLCFYCCCVHVGEGQVGDGHILQNDVEVAGTLSQNAPNVLGNDLWGCRVVCEGRGVIVIATCVGGGDTSSRIMLK